MTAPEMIRPKDAAARFRVCERTLSRWARAGLIGRSVVDRTVWYVASDCADVIAHGLTPRVVVPIATTTAAPAPADNWRDDDFWKGAAR